MVKQVKVLIKEPGQPAKTEKIPSTLEALQEKVGGYIERVPMSRQGLAMIVDEDGKLKNKRSNIMCYELLQSIVGTIVVIREKRGKYVDLTLDDILWAECYLDKRSFDA